jgi:hypothetical protein
MRRDLPQRRRDRREKIGRADSGAVRHRPIIAPQVAASVSPPLHTSVLLRALSASAVINPRSVGDESHKAHFEATTSARHTGETPVPPTPPLLPLVTGPWSPVPRLQKEAHP